MTASIGAQALGNKLTEVVSKSAEGSKLLTQVKQAKKVAETLSQMKGAAMKLGQMISIHGEHLLPKEVTDVLAVLQSNSVAMEYPQIEKVMKRELKADGFKLLENFSKEPIASASIGQVHQANYGPDKLAVAVKVQYPGVDKSIDSDVDSLATLLSVLAKLPSVKGFKQVTDEIKTILKQETDYKIEAANMAFYKKFFEKNKQILVPQVFPEVSTKHVLVSELVEGMSVQEFAQSQAPQEVRDQLGQLFLSIFYEELFLGGKVQTDPNFANYKIRWKPGQKQARLVLLDFGAVKDFDSQFRTYYSKLLNACVQDDYEGIKKGAMEMGFLEPQDPQELIDKHYELVKLFVEPFLAPYGENNPYLWAQSDLPQRIRSEIPKFVLAFKLRPPPRDIVFLNRKIAGIYFFLSSIRAEFWPRPLLFRVLESAGKQNHGKQA